MDQQKIYIIGAGISGLIAAYEFERAGYSPIILESSESVGGRVRTDSEKGFLMDRGFQVLLTAYPEAKRYLDYEKLNLKMFDPGALVFKPGDFFAIHDPLRNPMRLLGMAFSKVGTLKDKFKILSLTNGLKKKTEEDIFAAPSIPTIDFLRNYGFSETILDNFFKPFFKGIFLENELQTSSRMFNFVFKMFSIGNAAVPENGMQEIPNQLKNKLQKTIFHFNSPVERVEGKTIHLKEGKQLQADKIIIASRPDKILTQLDGQFKEYRKVINLYFSLEKSFIAQPMIGLVPDAQFLINNLVFMTDVSKSYSSSGKALLSVTVTKDSKADDQLIKLVTVELESLTGISASFFHHIKTYEILEALPQVDDMQYTFSPTNTKIQDDIYLAGDYLLNGSINAAMTAGRKAAEAVMLSLQPTH
ncbi:FAD-dependent oxidoreductase [Aquiflexum sp. TKW24L]|uniref:protoporphyrinogen/coproporphyrinogen oxidase n=1 Tax=Aquiflexum sp. TKW24L TaxID=2942212 RepID=UPI0020C17D38|nr:NAD(P)/FAD-dependent oxidoreductase [Aquiflexum sp. TKW24L]MCL6258159.1 FAD-dependent oxidoreductase [Aquiflexum sp. TKW24L]